MQISGAITGNGSVSIANNAKLDLDKDLEAGDFSMEAGTILDVAANKTIDLNGDFTFAQTTETNWIWGSNTSLTMSGEGDLSLQSLEIGGHNDGSLETGFSNNFDLANLSIEGEGTYTYLTDWIDNGNRSSDEALYVDDLDVLADAILNLKGLNLYTYLGSDIHLVAAGEGYLFGGGQIIDATVPIPGALWLFGSGLIAMVGIRRRKKR